MFKNAILSVALLASSAFGAITFNSAPSTVVAGQTYTLTWAADGTGPVTILLRAGPSINLQTVGTITETGTGGSYAWTAPATYPPGTDYAFQIIQGTDFNYYGPFTYTGGVAVSSAAPVSSASAIAPSASSAASASVHVSASVAAPSSYPTLTPSVYKNSTSSTLKPSSSSTLSPSAAKPSATIVSANSAMAIGSPLALVFSVVAAMLYLQ